MVKAAGPPASFATGGQTVPLFLSVVLELSALQTGVRLLPLSVALLAATVGIPKLAPNARPRLVVPLGLLSLTAGTLDRAAHLTPGGRARRCHSPVLCRDDPYRASGQAEPGGLRQPRLS
jgi:hypothetical protein